MASFSSSSLSAILAKILKDVDKVLEKEVANVVKEHISDSVRDEVFSKGTPIIYERRGEGSYIGTGSLRDPEEMISVVSSGTLEVVDAALPSAQWGMDLDRAIIEGYGDRKHWYNEPRDFIGDTRQDLETDKAHVSAMKKGLIDKGYTVV